MSDDEEAEPARPAERDLPPQGGRLGRRVRRALSRLLGGRGSGREGGGQGERREPRRTGSWPRHSCPQSARSGQRVQPFRRRSSGPIHAERATRAASTPTPVAPTPSRDTSRRAACGTPGRTGRTQSRPTAPSAIRDDDHPGFEHRHGTPPGTRCATPGPDSMMRPNHRRAHGVVAPPRTGRAATPEGSGSVGLRLLHPDGSLMHPPTTTTAIAAIAARRIATSAQEGR